MTHAKCPKNKDVYINAGGRGDWLHNPDTAEIESISIESERLILKASAGGIDRGIAIQWSLPDYFLLEKYAECQGIEGSELEIIDGLINHLVQKQRSKLIEKAILVHVEDAGFSPSATKALLDSGLQKLTEIQECGEVGLQKLGIKKQIRNSIKNKMLEFGVKL